MIIIQTAADPIKMTMARWGLFRNLLSLNCVKKQHAIGKQYLYNYMANYGTILVVDDNPAILTAAKICLDGVFERIITLSKPDSIMVTLNQ